MKERGAGKKKKRHKLIKESRFYLVLLSWPTADCIRFKISKPEQWPGWMDNEKNNGKRGIGGWTERRWRRKEKEKAETAYGNVTELR